MTYGAHMLFHFLISIHAPVKGATGHGACVMRTFWLNFNPRTREGCDQPVQRQYVWNLLISIHAPVKGATHQAGAVYFLVVYFNPRTREGCDSSCISANSSALNFNPRTREGCDPAWLYTCWSLTAFQSTHP